MGEPAVLIILVIIIIAMVVTLALYIDARDAKCGLPALRRRYGLAEMQPDAKPLRCSLVVAGGIPHPLHVGLKLGTQVLILHEKPFLAARLPSSLAFSGAITIPLSHITCHEGAILGMLRRMTIDDAAGFRCRMMLDVRSSDFHELAAACLAARPRLE